MRSNLVYQTLNILFSVVKTCNLDIVDWGLSTCRITLAQRLILGLRTGISFVESLGEGVR
jgi:hypothetical protein